LLWSRLPPEVVTHWNLRGEPDGWMSRGAAALLGPALVLVFTGIAQVLPTIDPRRENYARFSSAYWLVINGLILFFAFLHVAVLVSGAGARLSIERVIVGGLAVLLLVVGNALGRIRPNWFLGIRTPWTLESPDVWRKTHRLAAWLFVSAGLVVGAAAFLPFLNPLVVAFVAAIIAAAVPALLSLVFWFREKHP
jgi:uncharacterized membrane protein